MQRRNFFIPTLHLTAAWTLLLLAAGTGPALGQQNVLYETAKLEVPPTLDDIEFQDFLGRAVSVTDTTAWLGEYNDNGQFVHQGQVVGFERTAEGWAFARSLRPSDAHKSQSFGRGLAFLEDWGVVGSPRHSKLRYTSGAAYVYRREGANWVQEAILQQPDPNRLEFLGFRVAISEDRILLSSTGDSDAGHAKGAAYVYRRTPGGWVLEGKLIGHHPGTDKWKTMSYRLDLDGDVAVLSANAWDPNAEGIVFVFEHTPSGWVQTAILQDPTPTDDDEFGWSVAVEDDTIVVGEHVDIWFESDRRPGSVFVFERQGPGPGGWTLLQEVQASNKSVNKSSGDRFGSSVDIHGDRFLVGAIYGKVGDVVRGTAYLFERGPDGLWEETAMLTHTDPRMGHFGEAVSLSSSFALVGAPVAVASVPKVQSGHAFVFELPFGTPYCDAAPNSTGAAATVHATGSLAASAEALELWAEGLPAHEAGMFLVSPDAGFVPNPGGSQGDLCLGGRVGRLTASAQSSGSDGSLHHVVDTTAIPPHPAKTIQPGETWRFQAWYRDRNPTPTSNFTPGLEVEFR